MVIRKSHTFVHSPPYWKIAHGYIAHDFVQRHLKRVVVGKYLLKYVKECRYLKKFGLSPKITTLMCTHYRIIQLGGICHVTCVCILISCLIGQANGHEGNDQQKKVDEILEAIFNKYGTGGNLTFEGFEHLLNNLGIGQVEIKDHRLENHFKGKQFLRIHEDHQNHEKSRDKMATIRSESEKKKMEKHLANPTTIARFNHGYLKMDPLTNKHRVTAKNDTRNQITSDSKASSNKSSVDFNLIVSSKDYHWNTISPVQATDKTNKLNLKNNSQSECLSPVVILSELDMNVTQFISKEEFLTLCPIMIDQIDRSVCSQKISTAHKTHHVDISDISLKVWGYTGLSVLIISMVGLLGVAVIPFMTKIFYAHLLEFLIALAVGSLSGDACLHLLPHSFQEAGRHSEDGVGGHDKSTVWRGLTCVAGIYMFFNLERLLKRCLTKKKQKSEFDENDQKMSNYKYSKNYDAMVPSPKSDTSVEVMQDFLDKSQNDEESNHDHTDDDHHNEHSHGHSHSHKVPNSVSEVAWIVIVGDGLHNLCDGLAIGASFAGSIAGGVSTTVAVFCHELPHELGDFAMLLNAGMRVKQAMFYNLFSSLLCFIGAIAGLLLGNVPLVSQWLFALVGGMFIYIALVDMLPTLVQDSQSHNAVHHFLCQSAGIFFGIGLMLLIALYEDEIDF